MINENDHINPYKKSNWKIKKKNRNNNATNNLCINKNNISRNFKNINNNNGNGKSNNISNSQDIINMM